MFEDVLNLFKNVFEKPFKVGIISYYYPYQNPSISGVGTHVYNLVTHLSKLGCEVHVFTYSDKKDNLRKIRVGNGKIILHFLKASFPFEIDDSVISKRTRYAIFENLVLNEASLENSRSSFDILHTHGWLTSSAFMLKYLYSLPWVHTVHALERNRLPSMTDEEKRLYNLTSWIEDTIVNADKLIAVSNSASKELIRAFGNKISKKIEVIPNGVDLELFNKGNSKSKSILSISRFSKEKGIELLPKIADKVLSADDEAEFKIIAPETQISTIEYIQDSFRELEKKYGKRFNWISKPLLPLEIAPYYKHSSIYLQPSFYETFGLCIVEGMASGNAIVATNVGGIPEVVGKAGILVEPNAEDISSGIIKLLKSNNLLESYKKKSLERAKLFNWSIIVKKTFDLYKEVIRRKIEIESQRK